MIAVLYNSNNSIATIIFNIIVYTIPFIIGSRIGGISLQIKVKISGHVFGGKVQPIQLLLEEMLVQVYDDLPSC